MKRVKRFLKCIAFVLLVVLGMYFLGRLFDYKWDGDYDDNDYFNFKMIYDEPKDTLDVLYVGTSQIHRGIAPLNIWNEQEITGESLTIPALRSWLAYYMLEEALKYQSPRVVVLDGALLRSNTDYDTYNFRQLEQFKLSKTKIKAYIDCLGLEGKSLDNAIDKSFSFFRYHDRWDELNIKEFTASNEELAFLKGFLPVTTTVKASAFNHERNQNFSIDMSDRTLEYMEKIVQLCREKKAELVITQLPTDVWTDDCSEAIGEWADEHDIDFLDFTAQELQTEIGFNEDTDYADSNHVNFLGAEKISSYIGEYLKSNYEFAVHSDEIASAWDSNYEKWLEYRKTRVMKATKNVAEFFEMFDAKDYMILTAVSDEATNGLTDEEAQSLIENAGMPEDLRDLYRYSILTMTGGGEVITEKHSLKNSVSCNYTDGSELEITMKSVGYAVNGTVSIKVNGTEYASSGRGIKIVVYDKTNDEVICSRSFDTFNSPEDR